MTATGIRSDHDVLVHITRKATVSGYTRINMMAIDPSPAAEEYGIDARFGRRNLDSDHLGVS